ncbi:MAG: hypothetical protein ACYC3L_17660 [Gemmatimonadaceae bacterium]
MRALSTALLLLIASRADAQFGAPVRASGSHIWLSAGSAWAQGGTLSDGTTQSTWSLGQYSPLRLSFELGSGRSTLGAVVTHAVIPIQYSGPACSRCDADIDALQMLGTLHIGNGSAGSPLHQILELSAGVTQWSKLTARNGTAGGSIAKLNADNDLTFQAGYGFGYNFGDAFAITLVQDVSTVIHQKDGLDNGQSRSLTQHTTRLGARLRLGR